MNLVIQHFTCPCCGWDKLECAPYKNFPTHPVDTTKLSPPYDNYWGQPSYDVCSCCGFEFGHDDEPGMGSTPDSFQSALQYWINEMKMEWFEPEQKPKDWDLEKQLKKAGIPSPNISS